MIHTPTAVQLDCCPHQTALYTKFLITYVHPSKSRSHRGFHSQSLRSADKFCVGNDLEDFFQIVPPCVQFFGQLLPLSIRKDTMRRSAGCDTLALKHSQQNVKSIPDDNSLLQLVHFSIHKSGSDNCVKRGSVPLTTRISQLSIIDTNR